MPRRTLPFTATAAVACLFVSVASPHTAVAATTEQTAPAVGVQQYAAGSTTGLVVERDGFSVGRTGVAGTSTAPTGPVSRIAAALPTQGAIPAAGGFGSRWVTGCAACSTNHQGVDFAAPIGTTVVAAMPGRVVTAAVLGGYGNQVLLVHADGSETRYGHLSRIDVLPGQVVDAGQAIGAVGNTGVSTGAHLHFEVIVGGVPTDPLVWLRVRGLL
ncbi:M23 family metallopeptidase [Curtobacterium sp. PhB115]|uniref:M23 family metallopeptidase n=1 Tax=Curtobacterium sp. PhB115 TaxID=2485173 RepID=UPI000FA13B14|nr:M23 family metallopeptidase [Curtobacterium sp. PhB115]ROP74662.1 peptidase M23-like protein [Curtobacterium sp. PhB115]